MELDSGKGDEEPEGDPVVGVVWVPRDTVPVGPAAHVEFGRENGASAVV